MNISKVDFVKSLESDYFGSFVAIICLIILTLPFYAVWTVYFLSEVFFLRKKIRALVYRGPSCETNRLHYQYKGEYYKCILIVLILFIEPIYTVPGALGLHPGITSTNFSQLKSIVQLTCNGTLVTYVLALILIFLLNTLTQHLINVCKSDCRIQLLPPIQHRLVILTLIAMILTAIKLAIQEFDNTIVEVVCAIFSSYEYWSLFKNSQQLYYLLKWRYQDMRYESNYPLYKAHRRMAQKYKYLTIYLMFGAFFQFLASWVHIPLTFFYTVLEFNYPPSVLLPVAKPVIFLRWTVGVCLLIGSTPVFLLVGVSLYYLAAVCWNKTVLYGRNRIYYIKEPQIQQGSS